MNKITFKNRFISHRKGFTLMEIVFVILVIALIVSFALPAFRAVRFDVKNSRAKNALKKVAEARRSFFQQTKGWGIAVGSFQGSAAKGLSNPSNCSNPARSGVPPLPNSQSTVEVGQLFACGYLDWKDFADLPYTFYICNLSSATADAPCNASNVYAGAIGNSAATAGSKYYTVSSGERYWMRVYALNDEDVTKINVVVDNED